jgi:hypothetical protein
MVQLPLLKKQAYGQVNNLLQKLQFHTDRERGGKIFNNVPEEDTIKI